MWLFPARDDLPEGDADAIVFDAEPVPSEERRHVEREPVFEEWLEEG
jgi:hypothetical protein